ncbi:hypothetical protein WJX73_003458 [Symbiochloris irregularis]|uniref:FHA domain-containing protein n=1 Tax=Symbiochloris irregularis TaxID=706552 RepID=A0AAW1PBS6_9CHLO
MDRWSQDDDLGPRAPASKVTRLGLGGFTKSSVGYGSTASEPLSQIEVVASKREQKQQQQQQQQQQQTQPSSPARPPVPAWAATPPPRSQLGVFKEGTAIQQLLLTRPATVFGRGATADIVCEHGSLSRQHAQLCYKPATRQWLVVDLGSTHGTFVDGKRIPKGTPIELKSSSSLRFGASTRTYALQQSASASTLDPKHAA